MRRPERRAAQRHVLEQRVPEQRVVSALVGGDLHYRAGLTCCTVRVRDANTERHVSAKLTTPDRILDPAEVERGERFCRCPSAARLRRDRSLSRRAVPPRRTRARSSTSLSAWT